MGRDGKAIGSPCSASAPGSGSTLNALTWCFPPAGPLPDPPSLVATYRNRREACGQTYCTLAGSSMLAPRVSVAALTSTSYCVSSAPTLAYRTSLDIGNFLLPGIDKDLGVDLGIGEVGEGGLHTCQSHLPGDQRRHVNLAIGNKLQAVGKFVLGIGQHELHVQLLDDAEERLDPVGFHAHAHDD